MAHARQRQVLEKIIRLLDKSAGDKPFTDDIDLAKAKAHLYRSRLIRPKGFTVPAKKIEGLYKALDSCLESDKKWHKHYAGVIALELDRCGQSSENLFENDSSNREPAKLLDLLIRAMGDNHLDNYNWEPKIEFFKMRLRLEELKLNIPNEKCFFSEPILRRMFKQQAKALRLEQLKASIYLNDKRQDQFMNKLIESLLYLPFSHVIWDDSVRFVRRLRTHKYKI